MPGRPRVAFVADIITPYYVAVHGALADLVDLEVLYCSASGTRALEWQFDDLPYANKTIGGLTIRRSHPDATDFYISPRILTSIAAARPDAIIVGGYSFPTAYAALYSRVRGVPYVIHSDGTAASEAGLGRLQRGAREVVVPRAAAAVANSEPAAQRFAELGFPADRIFRAPHSTNVAPFHAVARTRRRREQGAPLRVLATGRLIARKGFDRLIRACAQAQRERPGISLSIVGTGPEEDALRSLAAELDAPVEFAGFVDQQGLPAVYAEADAYAFPTLDDPFGIVLLEAAAAALPIVASPHGGATHDLLGDEQSGLVRDPDDITAWAEALIRLFDDPELCERLGGAAHQASLTRTPEATANGYAEAVTTVLGESAQ